MKKCILSTLFLCSGILFSYGQSSQGGMPQSFHNGSYSGQDINTLVLETPDFEAIIKQEEEDERNGVPKPYMLSTYIESDISLEDAASYNYLPDGTLALQYKVSIPESKGIEFFFDEFYLPEGVELFFVNENKKQILGAYNISNNNEYRNFVTAPIVGDVAYIEINVKQGASLSEMKLHIDKIGAFYRGLETEERVYSNTNKNNPIQPTGNSHSCNIDAICEIEYPTISSADYVIPKAASLRILAMGPGGSGSCSGTLINNTGNKNSGEPCKPLFLTASHCDGSNSRTDADFSQWRFFFNYEHTVCDGNEISPDLRTMTGASFRSRSNNPSFTNPSNSLVMDFLLLELNNDILDDRKAYLAGWNRETDLAFDPDYYNFFIGYHHPGGNPKKQSYGTYIDGSGRFNQITVPATHWYIPFSHGCTEPGSSGSGLFDVDGLLIGDLSGGSGLTEGLYSKISYAWENNFDQTTFPQHAGASSRLKDWLDPLNTGQTKLGPTISNCSDMVNVSINEIDLERSLILYPNPSTSGIINTKINLSQTLDIDIDVFDILGKKQKSFEVKNVLQGEFSIDCSDLSDGIYFINYNVGSTSVNKKVVISK